MRKKSDESKKETGTDTGGHLIREVATETERALEEARELLAEVTPLKRDCGRLCGARC